jgi:hypothetical protein
MEKLFEVLYIKYSIITVVTLLVAFVISKIFRILLSWFLKLSSSKLKTLSITLFAGAVILTAFVWREDHSRGFVLKTNLYKLVKEQSDQQGIEIPFPYRTIVYKKEI